jgi:hypothetical protein
MRPESEQIAEQAAVELLVELLDERISGPESDPIAAAGGLDWTNSDKQPGPIGALYENVDGTCFARFAKPLRGARL